MPDANGSGVTALMTRFGELRALADVGHSVPFEAIVQAVRDLIARHGVHGARYRP